MTDFITIVEPTPKGVLTKRISKHGTGYRIKSQAAKLQFSSYQEQVKDIRSLSTLLTRIEGEPNRAALRGRLSELVDSSKHFRRKMGRRNDGTGAYEEAPHSWVMIDLDGMPANLIDTSPLVDPEQAVRELVGLLPELFHNVTCHWQFSSSQGFKDDDSISLHLWFWLDIECDDEDLRAYFNVINETLKTEHQLHRNVIDTVTNDSIQVHFTASPILVEIEDPLPARSGLLVGSNDEVPISSEWRFTTEPGRFHEYLERIGDDKGGFHYPVLQAVASWITEFGKPDERSRSDLRHLIRGTIEGAVQNEDRSELEIERYKSDRFLNAIIDGAIEKGFDRAAPNRKAILDVQQRYVYIATSDSFLDVKSRVELKSTSMNSYYMHLTAGRQIVPALLVNPEFRKVDVAQVVPGDEEELTEVGPLSVYNTWEKRPYEPEKGNVKWLMDHLKYLTDYDKEGYEHLAWYLAHCIARPGVKIRHGVVLGSARTGTGKSFIRILMENVIGKSNVGFVNNDALKEHYNNWAVESEVVFIEELMTQGRLEIANKMKPLISEETLQVRKMYTPSYVTRNFTNYICFTNHPNAMVLHDRDRRYWVWFSDAEPKEPGYYTELFLKVKEQAAAIYYWALNYDLSQFDPGAPAPMTESKTEMEAHSEDPLTAFLREAKEAETWPFKRDLVVVQDLLMALPPKFSRTSGMKLSMSLKTIGAEQLGQKRMPDGSRPKMWAVRNCEDWKIAGEAEVRKEYNPPGRYDSVEGVDF